MISNEIRKNEEKQEKIETLEEIVKTLNDDRNQNDSDTKIALECAKDVILEYKAQVTRLTKEKDIEVGKIMVEKIRLEEDLRLATLEKKKLSDSERILLNTFDTLKKYYDTKENEASNNTGIPPMRSAESSNSRKKQSQDTTKHDFNKHTDKEHRKKYFKCTKCNLEAESLDKINEHMAIIHMNDEEFKCRKCNFKGMTNENLSHHMADVHNIDIRPNQKASQRHISEKRADMRHNRNRRMGGRETKEICIYWNRGYCRFGDKCFNAHEESHYCYFQERCLRKSTCKFFHADIVDNFLEMGSNEWYQR